MMDDGKVEICYIINVLKQSDYQMKDSPDDSTVFKGTREELLRRLCAYIKKCIDTYREKGFQIFILCGKDISDDTLKSELNKTYDADVIVEKLEISDEFTENIKNNEMFANVMCDVLDKIKNSSFAERWYKISEKEKTVKDVIDFYRLVHSLNLPDLPDESLHVAAQHLSEQFSSTDGTGTCPYIVVVPAKFIELFQNRQQQWTYPSFISSIISIEEADSNKVILHIIHQVSNMPNRLINDSDARSITGRLSHLNDQDRDHIIQLYAEEKQPIEERIERINAYINKYINDSLDSQNMLNPGEPSTHGESITKEVTRSSKEIQNNDNGDRKR